MTYQGAAFNLMESSLEMKNAFLGKSMNCSFSAKNNSLKNKFKAARAIAAGNMLLVTILESVDD